MKAFVQNSREGKDFNDVVKDTRDSIQFLQENAAPTAALVQIEKPTSSISIFMVGLCIFLVAFVAIYFFRRPSQN